MSAAGQDRLLGRLGDAIDEVSAEDDSLTQIEVAGALVLTLLRIWRYSEEKFERDRLLGGK